jgi:hypothetical protein
MSGTLAVISGITGTILGGLMAYMSGVRFIELNQRIGAGRALRAELLSIAIRIDPKGETSFLCLDHDAIDVFDKRHYLACEFMHHLRGKRLEGFSAAWDAYRRYIAELRAHGRSGGDAGKNYMDYNIGFFAVIDNVIRHT